MPTASKVTVYVVGGCAVMLSVRPDRGGTKDVDTWINADEATRAAVHGHIEQLAAERGWPGDWLNENAKNFIPEAITGDVEEWEPYIEFGDVMIVLARADVLLAMKLRAGRPLKDLPDLAPLVSAAGVITLQQALHLFDGPTRMMTSGRQHAIGCRHTCRTCDHGRNGRRVVDRSTDCRRSLTTP